MGFIVSEEIFLSDNLYKIFQGGRYEEFLCDLMNESTIIFPNNYLHKEKQSNGECDFIDTQSKKKYDAKLPFNPEIGKAIGGEHDYLKWYKLFLTMEEEFSEIVEKQGISQIKNSRLYNIIYDRLNSTKPDENIILFFPLTIVPDLQDLFMGLISSDVLTIIYDEIKKQCNIEKEIIVIYPDGIGNWVLRRLNNNEREYLKYDKLKKYIDHRSIFRL